MPTEIVNPVITHISLVTKGANGKRFAIVKSDQQPQIIRHVPILKTDEEKRQVTGVVYEPDAIDAHGEFMTADSIEKAAHQFLVDSRNIDLQHNWQSGYGDVVESSVMKSDAVIGGETVKAGSWVVTVKVNDESAWEAIKKGEISGFSMGGMGERIVHPESSADGIVAKMQQGIQKALAPIMQMIQKGELASQYKVNAPRKNMMHAFSILDDIVWDEAWKTNPDLPRIAAACQDLLDIFQQITSGQLVLKEAIGEPTYDYHIMKATGVIEKAGKAISAARMAEIKAAAEKLNGVIASVEGVVEEVTPEQMQEIVKQVSENMKAAVDPIVQRVDQIEKSMQGGGQGAGANGGNAGAAGEQPGGTAGAESELVKQLESVVKAALDPITQRVEQMETFAGVRKSVPGQDPLQKSADEKSIWQGVL